MEKSFRIIYTLLLCLLAVSANALLPLHSETSLNELVNGC